MKDTVTLFAILLALSLVAFVAVFPLFHSVEYSDILGVSSIAFATLCPLCVAARDGNLPKVKELIEKGEDVNSRDGYGNTILMLVAAKGIEIVKFLLENGAKINEKNKKGNTALMLMAEQGNTEIVKFLLENGASVDEQNNNGMTALMLAAREGKTEAGKLLLEYGADPDMLNHKNEDMWNIVKDTKTSNDLEEHFHMVQKRKFPPYDK